MAASCHLKVGKYKYGGPLSAHFGHIKNEFRMFWSTSIPSFTKLICTMPPPIGTGLKHDI